MSSRLPTVPSRHVWLTPLALALLAVACSGGSSPSSTDAGRDASHDGPRHDGGTDAGGDSGPTNSPTLTPTTASNLAFSSAYLYSGANPVQTGVAHGTIDITRVSVVRGQVLVHSTASSAVNGVAAVEGVTVTVVGHPEFGQTTTQSDGWFSMAVNGGGLITVNYESSGFLQVQRQATTRWLDYALTKPTVLTEPEPGTSVTLSASSKAFQVVRGKTHGTATTMTPTEDADGARTATLVIPPGTTANVSGLNETATTIRATEFTTGATGLQAMPAELPATTAYTYAVDFRIDEANGKPVSFSQPVLFYLDNFIGFPVGDGTKPTTVPAGYYDFDAAQWMPSPSGQIVKVLTNAGGAVTLDITGSGQDAPDSAFTPPLLAGERAQIAALYQTRATFWRVSVPHFSCWDYNWGYGPPAGAVAPDVAGPTVDGPGQTAGDPGGTSSDPGPTAGSPDDNSCHVTGSIIECENQILAEQFPVAGTPFGLRYQSERTAGRLITLQIPITGSTPLPSIVTGIEVSITTQGLPAKTFSSTSLAANQFVTWTWDRKDAYGRIIEGHSDIQVTIGYDYQGTSAYQSTTEFGAYGGVPISGNRALKIVTFQQVETIPVDEIDASTMFGLGGLSLTAQDLYDPYGETWYGGDGTRRTIVGNHFETISIYAGIGGLHTPGSYPPEGVQATAANIGAPTSVAVGPDGTVYIAAGDYVDAVDPKTHDINEIAGNGNDEPANGGSHGDNQSALSQTVEAYGLSVDPQGEHLYITTTSTNRVRKLDLGTGIVTTIAGNGKTPETCGPSDVCGDGTAATSVPLNVLTGVAWAPDGIYFSEVPGSDATGGRVRKVGNDGILTTVMNGNSSPGGLWQPNGLKFGADGSLYVADGELYDILRMTPSGAVTVVAGSHRGSDGDGGPATQAGLFAAEDIAVEADGSFYIVDSQNETLRFVDTAGIIHTLTNPNARSLAGETPSGYGAPAGSVSLYGPTGLALGPNHALYIAENVHKIVSVIEPMLPSVALTDAIIARADGSSVDQFDDTGKHQHTFDPFQGQTMATMAYDTNGFLSSVKDNAGNVTSIDRSQAGKVVITAPFGQKTTLAIDSAGFVTTLTNPNQETVGFTYGTSTTGEENGLLATLTDPKGQVHSFAYSSDGYLIEDKNPAGGDRTLARSVTGTSWSVLHTTKMGYESQYTISSPTTGGWEREVITPTGASSTYVEAADGTQTLSTFDILSAPVATSVTQLGPDPRYGMVAPIAASTTTTLEPSGLAMTVTHTRTAAIGATIFDLQTQTDVFTVNPGAPSPKVLTTTYTAGGSSNMLSVQTALGRSVTATLDAQDRITTIAVPGLATSTLTYNTTPCGTAGTEGCGARLLSITAKSVSDGTRTWNSHYQYSPDTGFASSVVDALGQAVSWTRDPVGRPKQTQLPTLASTTAAQNQIATAWDPNGNLSSVAVPSTATPAPTHSFPVYDPVDNLTTYSPPALTPPLATANTTYAYNFDSQLTSIQVPDGATSQTIAIGYDPFGRLSTVTDSKSLVTRTLTYAPNGFPQSLTTSDGETLVYGFGADGPLPMSLQWKGTVNGTVSVTHDAFFRTASRSVDGGTPVTYAYDADGLFAGTSGLVTMSLTRDFNGKNGLLTGSTLGSVSDSLTYNGFGEVKSYAASYNGTPLYSLNVTARDPNGRIKSATEKLGSTSHNWAFAYDAHNALASVTEDGTTVAYTYDPNGNRLSAGGQASTYDAQDRLLTGPGATYTYTNNGDLLTKVTSSGPTTYSYDLLSALRSVTLSNGDTVSYVVDGSGRRVGRTWTHAGQTVTQGFLYDSQLRIAAELDGQGNVVSTFVYGVRGNVPDAMVRGGKTYRLVSDWRGSVRAVVDASAGTVVETFDYDAWGNATVSDTTCVAGAVCAPFQPFGFAGGLYDRETMLVRFGARDYDASVGRWTQKDGAGFGGGRNFYVYANGDAVNVSDPTGYYPLPFVTPGLGTTLVGLTVGALGSGQFPTISYMNFQFVFQFSNNQLIGALPSTAAVTFGDVICYAPGEDNAATQAHELAHTEQFSQLGDLYPEAHIAAQVFSWATSGSYNGGNLLEQGPYSSPPRPWPW